MQRVFLFYTLQKDIFFKHNLLYFSIHQCKKCSIFFAKKITWNYRTKFEKKIEKLKTALKNFPSVFLCYINKKIFSFIIKYKLDKKTNEKDWYLSFKIKIFIFPFFPPMPEYVKFSMIWNTVDAEHVNNAMMIF